MPDSPPSAIVLGVSACLLGPGGVLLVERGKAPFAGLLSLPGGRVEFGETLRDAVRREVREETGLDMAALDFLRFHEAIDRPAGLHVVIAVFRGRLPAGAAPVAASDAASLALHPLADVDALQAAGRLTDGLAPVVRAAALALAEDSPRSAGNDRPDIAAEPARPPVERP